MGLWSLKSCVCVKVCGLDNFSPVSPRALTKELLKILTHYKFRSWKFLFIVVLSLKQILWRNKSFSFLFLTRRSRKKLVSSHHFILFFHLLLLVHFMPCFCHDDSELTEKKKASKLIYLFLFKICLLLCLVGIDSREERQFSSLCGIIQLLTLHALFVVRFMFDVKLHV